MKKFKHYFFTGLLIILPIFLTLYLLYIIFKLIDSLLGGIINNYLDATFGFLFPAWVLFSLS